ncbi:hypothetical protein ES705_47044 [subsurface metagenome]
MRGTKTPERRDREELDRFVKALEATGHNPIVWATIIKFVAPIIARIASRFVIKLLARKLDKRISSKIREDVVIRTADHLADIAIKRTTTHPKK